MKIYRHWSRATATAGAQGQPVSCWGGSNVSEEDARARAEDKVAVVVARLARGERWKAGSYEAEIREEIVQEVGERDVVTRNRYGALVLNSEDKLFIDIDRAPLEPMSLLKSLFSGRRRTEKDAILERIVKAARRPAHAGLGLRVYETAKGMRVMVTGRPFAPRSPEAVHLLRDFNADPLYAKLCWKQACFRARLTPKPYRVKCKAFKVSYPRTPEEQAAFDAWLGRYEQASRPFGTCRLACTLGPASDNALIRFHDSATRAHETLQLA